MIVVHLNALFATSFSVEKMEICLSVDVGGKVISAAVFFNTGLKITF